jgi:hypothetical protein
MPRLAPSLLALVLLSLFAGAAAQSSVLARIASDMRIAPFDLCLERLENLDGSVPQPGGDVVSFLHEGSVPDERMRACLVTSQGNRWARATTELPGWTVESEGGDLVTGTWRDDATEPPTSYRAAAISSMGRDHVAVVADRFAALARVEPFDYARAVGDAVQAQLERTREAPPADCAAGYDPGPGFIAVAPAQPLQSCTVKTEIEREEDGMSYAFEVAYVDADGEANARSGAGFVSGQR